MTRKFRESRIPVSTVRTGCIPFNRGQNGEEGYKIGENPVKETGVFVVSFEDALDKLRDMKAPGWRNYGRGNSGSAHRSIGWVTQPDAERLLSEPDAARRIKLFESFSDVVD